MQAKLPPQWNMAALANRIQPRAAELAVARRHLAAVRTRFERSFDVSRFVVLGSHARQTAICRYSDLDLMVALRRNEAKWGGNMVSSRTVLSRVLQDLSARFPATAVRRDMQAAVISFGGGSQNLDVVPAIFRRFVNGRPVYLIPDGADGWFETSPETHNAFIEQASKRSGGKLRKVVQLVKWWKYSRARPIPLSSFHTDLLLATTGICAGVKPYTHCLHQVFHALRARGCRGLNDPCGIAGTVRACHTAAQSAELNNVVEHAYKHSAAAISAEAAKNYVEANRQWNIVFNGAF